MALYSIADGDTSSLVAALVLGDTPVIENDSSFSITSIDAPAILAGRKKIMAVGKCTLNFAEMDIAVDTVSLGSPYGHNITVVGPDMPLQTITSVSYVSQAAGDHRVRFNMADASAFEVGKFAIIKNCAGTGNVSVLDGCHEVMTVGAGYIIAKVKARKTTLPTVTVTGGDARAVKLHLRFTSNGLYCLNGQGGVFKNIAIVGNNSGTSKGVIVSDGNITLGYLSATPFAVTNFGEHGIYAAQKGRVECVDAVTCGNGQMGINALEGSIVSGVRAVANSNGTGGIVASINSEVSFSQGSASGNGSRGVLTGSMASVIGASVNIEENNGYGVFGNYGGYCDITGGYVRGNTTYGVRAYSMVNCSGVTFSGNGAGDTKLETYGAIIL